MGLIADKWSEPSPRAIERAEFYYRWIDRQDLGPSAAVFRGWRSGKITDAEMNRFHSIGYSNWAPLVTVAFPKGEKSKARAEACRHQWKYHGCEDLPEAEPDWRMIDVKRRDGYQCKATDRLAYYLTPETLEGMRR